jgi:DNA polymerase-1
MLVELDLFGGWYSRFSLDNLVRRWCEQALDKTVRKQFEKAVEMTPEMAHYAAEDAIMTVQVAKKQLEYIYTEYDGQMPWYTDIDEPAIWAILDMPPVRVDVHAWSEHAALLVEKATKLQEKLGFNAYSHKKVKEAIEEKLGKGIKNTNANETLMPLLAQLDVEHPAAVLIRELMDVREMRKASETYGDSWIEQHVEDEYVYPAARVTGAATGRMAYSDPNLQNIPARNMPIYRTFFIASPDHVIQVADVSQQEPWFSAFLSGDRVLLKELKDNVDLHAVTGDLFGVDRPRGKAINLGLNYGMSEYGLAARVGISVEKARAGILARDRRYRQLTGWKGERKNEARRNYRVNTVTGRPVWVNPYGNQWERQAINAPAQGSAADHTKLALVNIHQACQKADLPFRVTIVIHDEIVQDVPLEQAYEYAEILRNGWDMASAKLAPGMAMRADVESGPNWGIK